MYQTDYRGNIQLELGKNEGTSRFYPHGQKFILGSELPVVQDRFNEIYATIH